MGEWLSERTERDFQSMKAVERTRAKLRTCVRVRRRLGVEVNMVGGRCGGCDCWQDRGAGV